MAGVTREPRWASLCTTTGAVVGSSAGACVSSGSARTVGGCCDKWLASGVAVSGIWEPWRAARCSSLLFVTVIVLAAATEGVGPEVR